MKMSWWNWINWRGTAFKSPKFWDAKFEKLLFFKKHDQVRMANLLSAGNFELSGTRWFPKSEKILVKILVSYLTPDRSYEIIKLSIVDDKYICTYNSYFILRVIVRVSHRWLFRLWRPTYIGQFWRITVFSLIFWAILSKKTWRLQSIDQRRMTGWGISTKSILGS